MTRQLPDRLRLDRMATPIGDALIVTDEDGYLRAFDWADCEASMARLLRLHYGSLTPTPGAAPRKISTTVSEIRSHTLSGWPSPTDSLVNR